MKHQPIWKIARDRNLTIGRACYEVLCAAGMGRRGYPIVIRRQAVPERTIRQAQFILGRISHRPENATPGYLGHVNPTVGPRGVLP